MRQLGIRMWMRATRWAVAALIGSAMTTVGCGRPITPDEPRRARSPIVADDSLTHAFDTQLEVRLIDRLELDNFLRDREIHIDVADGVVHVTGEVWTALEKRRVSDVFRNIPGVLHVTNDLEVSPPE
jgi:hypothetical protein